MRKRKKPKNRLPLILLLLLVALGGFAIYKGFAGNFLRTAMYKIGGNSETSKEKVEETEEEKRVEPEEDKEKFEEDKDKEVFKESKTELITEMEKTETEEILKKLVLSQNDLHSQAACLMDLKTGQIIYSFNDDKKMYPASLTKIMTTLVALEENKDLTRKYTITQELYNKMLEEDASMAGYLPGEEVDYQDLIYGTMLPSGGEAAVGLAESCSKTKEAHLEKMNKKAEELGLKNTHFATVSGLHSPENISTAKDLAIMVKEAMKNKDFEKVFTKDTYNSSLTNEHPEGLVMRYSVLNYMDSVGEVGFKVLGGKTGYTEEAGRCLASTAIVDNRQYILVTLGAMDSETGHFEDAYTIYNRIKESKLEEKNR